ncbi:hypothetical protein SB861_63435, partial [Paraburkholderia sp. SIMBA_049]
MDMFGVKTSNQTRLTTSPTHTVEFFPTQMCTRTKSFQATTIFIWIAAFRFCASKHRRASSCIDHGRALSRQAGPHHIAAIEP